MKQKILDEIDRRITNYGDFRHEMTAKVCLAELIDLHKWIYSIEDDADGGLPKAIEATEILSKAEAEEIDKNQLDLLDII